jgi:hypothetical protein
VPASRAAAASIRERERWGGDMDPGLPAAGTRGNAERCPDPS